jgi:pimeloyl-ACP methyl ester carboxylesterase
VLLNLIVTIIIFYGIYIGLLFLFQRVIIYPGMAIGERHFQTHWIKKDQINWIKTPVGKIETWFIPSKKSPDGSQNPVIIFAHGNYELIDFCEYETRELNNLGYDVFLIEYPGFGRSEGSASRETINTAYVSGYNWLIANRQSDPNKIVGFGRSLGGGAICDLVEKRHMAGVILQSTFSNVRSFAIRYGAPSCLVKDQFDNVDILKKYKNPVLIIHGRYDNIIPFWHGETLAQNTPQAEFIAYDCEHNDCPPDWERYWKTIARFLNRTFK